ncbi:MAG: hypothetical protein ACXWJW_07815 [Xanthobacteraceae bacterium]
MRQADDENGPVAMKKLPGNRDGTIQQEWQNWLALPYSRDIRHDDFLGLRAAQCARNSSTAAANPAVEIFIALASTIDAFLASRRR